MLSRIFTTIKGLLHNRPSRHVLLPRYRPFILPHSRSHAKLSAGNILLNGPWAKAARGEEIMKEDTDDLFLRPGPDVSPRFRQALMDVYLKIVLPTIASHTQGIFEANGELRCVMVDGLGQQAVAVQSLDDCTHLAANIMASNRQPSLAESVQFLAAHAMILRAIHIRALTPPPFVIGFVKPVEYPSTATASVIFSWSLPTYAYANAHDRQVRKFLHTRMKERLEGEVGELLPELAGRCAENEGFLGFLEDIRNGRKMQSFTVGIDSLTDIKPRLDGTHQLDWALLEATTEDELRKELKNDIYATLNMCPVCITIAGMMCPRGIHIHDLAYELGRRRGSTRPSN